MDGMCKWWNCFILNAPIATKVVCFSCLLKCLRSLYGKQCGPRSDCSYIGAVCSGSTLFASILNSSVMLGNYLQQTTSADDIFRCFFSLGALRVNSKKCYLLLDTYDLVCVLVIIRWSYKACFMFFVTILKCL